MDLALLWCWKEWRAQRAMLGAYSLLALACLCAVFLLVSAGFWEAPGGRALVLGCFIGAGVIGVVVFATPKLVSGEFNGRDDVFVRRLPGALLPSFTGKLLFLALASALLPLLGLVLGELFLAATGHGLDAWFPEPGNGCADVWPQWHDILRFAGWAMLAVPWIWALAMWLPGARMAVGATALSALLVALAVSVALRGYPGLWAALSWQPLALGGASFAVLLARASWVRGRRGGGHGSSVRIGAKWLAAGMLPLAAWVGDWIREYHHPDLSHIAVLHVDGFGGRFAIGRASAHEDWYPVVVRIDLDSGAIEQVGGIQCRPSDEVAITTVKSWPQRQRYWQLIDMTSNARELLDLDTGQRVPVAWDKVTHDLAMPSAWRESLASEQGTSWSLHPPDGFFVTASEGDLLFSQPGGTIEREPGPLHGQPTVMFPAGHGIFALSLNDRCWYDLALRRVVTMPGYSESFGWAVRGIWLAREDVRRHQWLRCDPERGVVEPCPELGGAQVVGLFDDDHLLAMIGGPGNTSHLVLYRPADRSLTPLPMPEALQRGRVVPCGPVVRSADPRDRVLLPCRCFLAGGRSAIGCLAIEPGTLAIEPRCWDVDEPDLHHMGMLAVLGPWTYLLRDRSRILQFDALTGSHKVLFPRGH